MMEFLQLDLTRISDDSDGHLQLEAQLKKANERLWSGKEDFTGWVRLPLEQKRDGAFQAELKRIKDTAAAIRKQCQAFVVIGIGGSYLGARAVISALKRGGEGYSGEGSPEIYFAGQNISGTYHWELLEKLKDKDFCLCVISKSGTTTEPSIAFSVLKDEIYKRYGKEEGNRRIYAITDAEKGILREETMREGYCSFIVPDDIGGRYSVLTAVGLLPIAVAGIDIDQLIEGAAAAAEIREGNLSGAKTGADQAGDSSIFEKLAAARIQLLKRGKVIEIFEYYEPKLQYFAEWLKQLFGESEGKDGKGIFPAALQFSTDLHSMGQFLQEGNQIFFETVLNIVWPQKDLTVPESAGGLLAGKSMNAVNQAAVMGVIAAHESAGIPIIKIDIPELSAYYLGQMIYFFETVCALSGYLMGVNPFNQPGVESYKNEMRKVLKG